MDRQALLLVLLCGAVVVRGVASTYSSGASGSLASSESSWTSTGTSTGTSTETSSDAGSSTFGSWSYDYTGSEFPSWFTSSYEFPSAWGSYTLSEWLDMSWSTTQWSDFYSMLSVDWSSYYGSGWWYNDDFFASDDTFYDDRSVQVTFADDTFHVAFTSTRPNADKIAFDMNTGNANTGGVFVRFQYYLEEGDTVSLLSELLEFFEFVEFRETSSTFNGYTPGTDTVVQTLEFERDGWQYVDYYESSGVHTFVAKYSTFAEFSFSFCDTSFEVASGVYLPPSQVKIDLDVHGFLFKESGTYLALGTKLQTSLTFSNDATFSIVQDGDNPMAMLFGWDDFVLADLKTVEVLTSAPTSTGCTPTIDGDDDGETCQLFYFSFAAENPRSITWDPVFGVAKTNSNSGGVVPCCLFLVALFAALAALF